MFIGLSSVHNNGYRGLSVKAFRWCRQEQVACMIIYFIIFISSHSWLATNIIAASLVCEIYVSYKCVFTVVYIILCVNTVIVHIQIFCKVKTFWLWTKYHMLLIICSENFYCFHVFTFIHVKTFMDTSFYKLSQHSDVKICNP